MPFITQGKTNWKFLLIVIVLAIIVGGGALWYTNRIEKVLLNLSQNPLPECNEDVNCGEGKICLKGVCHVEETAGWKNYTSTKYGYEIKYPQHLCVEEEPFLAKFMDCNALEKPELYAPEVEIDIFAHSTESELSLRDWLKQNGTEEDLRKKDLSLWSQKCPSLCLYSNVSAIKDIYINNIPALQFNAWLVTTDGIVVLMKKPSEKIIIDFTNFHTGIGTEGYSDKIFNQMLSTFKFLE